MFDLEAYTLTAFLFPRLLGMIYFFAFGAFIFQIKGLIGENGILPAGPFFKEVSRLFKGKKRRFLYYPSLFWLNQSNQALMGVILAGTLLSIGLMCGFYPCLLLILLYVLYLSVVTAGQDFLGYGWEGLLLETTLQGILISMTPIPNIMVWISTNLLVLRFHVQAGLVKLQSHDRTWKDWTAIAYHYQTQPLPNTIAWYFHKLPLSFHKFSCAMMFATEIFIPFGILLTQEIRLGVFAALFGLQFLIWFTGNFSFLNHLTAVMTTLLLNNALLSLFITPDISATPTSLYLDIFLTIAGTALASLQVMRLWHNCFPNRLFRWILDRAAIYHIANRYGIFAVMTTTRYEIVIEGSADGIEWKEYLFKWKPSETSRRPRRIAPYQPRIDWQAWFLPFCGWQSANWLQNFFTHLLLGTPDVLKLLRGNPFEKYPPKFVRAVMYEYVFSSFEEKKRYGWWWKRKYVGNYSPEFSSKK